MRPAGDDLAEHHLRQVRAPAVGGVAHDGDELPEHLIGRARIGAQRLDPLEELHEHLAKNGPIQLELAAEVIVDEGLVGSGLPGDLGHRRAVEPPRREQLGGSAQQGLPGGLGVVAAPRASSGATGRSWHDVPRHPVSRVSRPLR